MPDDPYLLSGIDIDGPVRTGRHVSIRPILPEDYGWAYETAVLTGAGGRWRLHGQAPNYESFLGILFGNTSATFMVVHTETRQRIGVVQVWNHLQPNRNAHLTAFTHPDFRMKGWPFEGFIMFAHYAFWAFDLHKVYLESFATEADQYRSLVGRYLIQEGHLREHRVIGRQWEDAYLFALYRDACDELAERFLPPSARYDPRPLRER